MAWTHLAVKRGRWGRSTLFAVPPSPVLRTADGFRVDLPGTAGVTGPHCK